MITLGVRVLISLLALLGAFPLQAVESGQVAPAFELNGRSTVIKLSDYRGKTVYLDFWASWCGPCKQSIPWMNEMHTRYGDKGLQVVGINVDQRESDATTFLRGTPVIFEVAFDHGGITPKAYAIKGMPTSVLIGPDGKVLSVHSGFHPQDRSAREKQIKEALRL